MLEHTGNGTLIALASRTAKGSGYSLLVLPLYPEVDQCPLHEGSRVEHSKPKDRALGEILH